jgi:hypothetical protein
VYVRLHKPSQDWLYGGSYSDDDLAWWAHRFRESGVEVGDVEPWAPTPAVPPVGDPVVDEAVVT